MRTVGFIASGIFAGLALLGIATGVRSIPDVQRYLRMRAM